MERNKLKLPKFKLNSNLLKLHYTYKTLLVDIVEELEKNTKFGTFKNEPRAY